MKAEIIVVDNDSKDGSQEYLKQKFGDQIILVENTDNPGYAKANNQGITMAKGRYVLLLNPDTVVAEDTFRLCVDFMDAHPTAGALGVKMIDGEGVFLPESKRALPTPWVSFYKIFGLASLFPKSKTFGKYHLSYLDQNKNHEVEILSGAYMFMRKSLLDEIGYLDESFFMYGEDIDLSYRVNLGGFKNYYLADAPIIHYKGESTKKGSLNYVKVFYQAMIIFAKKHFGGSRKQMFILAIRLAVYFRAFLAVMYRLWKRFSFPALEWLLSLGIILGVKAYWEHYVKYIEGGAYPIEFDTIYAPTYATVFIVLLAILGAYKKPFRLPAVVLGPFWGFIVIATATYMFPFIQNYSRAIVGLSSVFTMVMGMGTRGLINLREKGSFFFTESKRKRVLMVGNQDGINKIEELVRSGSFFPAEIVGAVSENEHQLSKSNVQHLGKLGQLKELINYFDINEILFAAEDIGFKQTILTIEELKEVGVQFKILPPESDFLIGPKEIISPDQPSWNSANLGRPRFKAQKRIFDIGVGLGLLLSFPILGLFYRKTGQALVGILNVLSGKNHLVGYIEPESEKLPDLRPGLLNMQHRVGQHETERNLPVFEIDSYYANHYHWWIDLEIVWKAWREIGDLR